MHRRILPTLALSISLAIALVLTGCSGAPAPSPSPTKTSRPTVAPAGDGSLKIGTLFPMTGEAAGMGAAQVAGTELAAREILEQGGLPGDAVSLVHRNSAVDPVAAVADLIARAVDVVLWDANTVVPPETAAALAAAKIAVIPLADFVHKGVPLVPKDPFVARLRSSDPALATAQGGAEAYDGVILTALADTVAGDDAGPSIEAGLAELTDGTTPCTSWGECLLAISEKQAITYTGATGAQT